MRENPTQNPVNPPVPLPAGLRPPSQRVIVIQYPAHTQCVRHRTKNPPKETYEHRRTGPREAC